MRNITVAAAALFISCAAHDAAFAGQDLPGAENMQEPPMEWFYDELDRNNDGLIDKEEFYAGYRDSGLFDDWDTRAC